jgi:predicted amidohydrolase YtcJ
MRADTVLFNGTIRTLNPEQPTASAIAFSRDRILALGDDDAMRDILAPGGEVVDLRRHLVIPGLTDAHVHLSWYADFLHAVDLFDTPSPGEAVRRVADRAAETPSGNWVRGRGWAQDDWPDRAFPTAAQLDTLVSDHPVYLTARSGHAAWVNSRALREANITANTPDPPGGQIQRDESGQPTGLLLEDALHLVSEVISTPTPEELADMMGKAIIQAHRFGLTGVHDFDGATCFRALQILHARGDLTLRVVKNIPVDLLDHAVELGLRWGFGDDFLRIGGVKTFGDGALGLRTAAMLAPYEGEPANLGIVVTDREEMVENVRAASAAGLPSTIHAIGDRAVHDVLDVYETVRAEEREWGIPMGHLRHRIEHVQLIHPDDVPRLAKLGLVASMQPIHATSDMLMADRYWGDRADTSYAWRLQLEAGAAVAFGSDAPVESVNPIYGIHAAVTRRRRDGSPGPDGWRSSQPSGDARLTVEEAMRGFTRGPAYAAGQEGKLGRLAPGFLADLVILDRDIFSIDPMDIAEVSPVGVVVGGKWVVRDL